jgi:hypothetical protein
MNQVLKDLIETKVKVWSGSSQQEHSDEGYLEAFEHPWLRLRRNGGEILCLCVYNVRLIKPVK